MCTEQTALPEVTLEIGDVVIWKWTIEDGRCKDVMCSCHTRMEVIDKSISRKTYDVMLRAINSRNVYYDRQEDLLVVQAAKRGCE